MTNNWAFRKATGLSPRRQEAHRSAKKLGSIWYGQKMEDNGMALTQCRNRKSRASGHHRAILREKSICGYRAWTVLGPRRECPPSWGDCAYLPLQAHDGTDTIQDLDKDDYVPAPYEAAPVETVFAMKKAEDKENQKTNQSRQKKLAELGFEGEHAGEVIF